jgi:hypothetical protein
MMDNLCNDCGRTEPDPDDFTCVGCSGNEAQADLLPCPFCGGEVSLEAVTGDRNYHDGTRQWWGIICRNVGNLGGTCAVQIAPSATKSAAIARWNMRDGKARQPQK